MSSARLLVRCMLPPLGAALAAHALLDFAGYSVFVRSVVGVGWFLEYEESFLGLREGVVVAVLLGGFGGFAATRRSAATAVRALGWGLLLVGIAAPLALAHFDRAALFSVHFGPYYVHGFPWGMHAARESLALVAVGVVLMLATLLCLRRPTSFEWLLGLLAGAGIVATVALLQRSTLTVPFEEMNAVSNGALQAASSTHRAAVALVWLCAGLLALHRVRMRRGVQTRGTILACGLAAVAFAATRAMGHDARGFLPAVMDPSFMRAGAVLPTLAGCDHNPRYANAVQLDAEGVWLSGTLLARPGDENARNAVAEKVANQRKQFEDLHSYANEPMPTHELAVQAAPSTPMQALVPILQGMSDGRVTLLQLESLRTLSLESKTQGHLEVHPRCVRHFELADDGVPVEQFATWGDVAKALDVGALKLSLLPSAHSKGHRAGQVEDERLPHLARCESPAQHATVLEVHANNEVRLNRRGLGWLEMPNARELVRDRLLEQRAEFRELYGASRQSAAHELVVAVHARAAMRIEDLQPYLRGLAEAGVTRVQLAAGRPNLAEPIPAGHTSRHPRCVRTFTLADDGVPLAAFETWGEVAKVLDVGELKLTLP